jgi:hypothetical protein
MARRCMLEHGELRAIERRREARKIAFWNGFCFAMIAVYFVAVIVGVLEP